MAKRVVLWPYEIYSSGARELQDYLQKQGVKCIRVYSNGRYHPKSSDLIVNWGNHSPPTWAYHGAEGRERQLNTVPEVSVARNKLHTFQKLTGKVPIPPFVTDPALASVWRSHGIVYLERHSLTGSQGSGIRIIEGEEIGTRAPLYVQYIKKKAEYRVHVFQGKVIDVQKKRKRSDFEGEVDSKIRNHSRGWVFCRNNVNPPNSVVDVAVRAVGDIGLDFGAVDVIWNEKQKQAYVLEINTAPGIEGTTVESYGRAILEVL